MKMTTFNPTRIVFEDTIFGKIPYYNKNQFNPDLPKINKICKKPFNRVEITTKGDVIVCCFDWLPVSLGNLKNNTLTEIWNGPKAEVLRSTMLDGTYKYCNRETCHQLIISEEKNSFVSKDNFQRPIQKFPENIILSIDLSCNLACPSCRSVELKNLSKENYLQSLNIAKSLINEISKTPHDEKIMISMDGCGEVFHSAVYRELLENEYFFQNLELWPNVTFQLLTNGVPMTEKLQIKYSKIFQKIEKISISIDAGNEIAYNKVRRGGNWDLLWKNINYLYKSILSNKVSPINSSWTWNLIIQEDNYESIPELISIAKKYTNNLPFIGISPLLNWGTFSDIDYSKKSIWQPSSEKYQDMLNILNLQEVKDYPRLYSPLTQ